MYKKHLICFIFSLRSFQAGFVDCKKYSRSKVYSDVFMTISLRSVLCLCAALCLCCGVVSAQQPTQQRFLRFLGQRSVTTGTLLPTVEPFRAGVPTTASLVFAIVDSEGRILKDDSTVVTLSLQGQNPDIYDQDKYFVLSNDCERSSPYGSCSYFVTCQRSPIPVRVSGGIAEFTGLLLSGKARNNALLVCSSATIIQTTLTVSLIGGQVAWFRFERMKNGQLTVPGRTIYDQFVGNSALMGTNPLIEVGKSIVLGTDTTDYQYITVRGVDRFNNTATFSTTVTISANGGVPPIDQQRTPLIGNVQTTDPITGLATFKDFQILGATASNIVLFFTTRQIYEPWFTDVPRGSRSSAVSLQYAKNVASLTCSPATPSSYGVDLLPGSAVGIVPNIIPDIYSAGIYPNPNRMPSRFTIGKSNADDPRTWFYVQAVDKFGNRVDNGPNAYNGGTATIRFVTPEEGLPRSSTSSFQFTVANDPFVRANSQRFAASGISAVAVNGLYTFNNFMPLGAASMGTTDIVVLTFEDPALKGVNSSFPLVPWLFRPIPPITTATTTFVRTTDVRLHEEALGLYATPNPTSDLLHIALALPESAPVLIRIEDMLGRIVVRHEEQSALQGAFATTLDVSHLAQGAYTLHVQSGRGQWARRVVILR
jgi:hypothetical protein